VRETVFVFRNFNPLKLDVIPELHYLLKYGLDRLSSVLVQRSEEVLAKEHEFDQSFFYGVDRRFC